MPQSDMSERPELAIRDIRLLLPSLILWGVTVIALQWGIRAIGAISISLVIIFTGSYIYYRKRQGSGQQATPSAYHSLLAVLGIALVAIASLTIRLYLAQPPHGGEVAELSGKIAKRPNISSTDNSSEAKPDTQEAHLFIRYTLATAQGEAVLTSTNATIIPAGTHVTVLARNTQCADNQLSRGEWSIISIRDVAPAQGLWALSNYLYNNWDSALSLLKHAHVFTPAQHSLTRGLTLGDTSGMSTSDTAAYRAAGLSHLTAVSGANVAYLLLFITLLLRQRTPRYTALVSTIALGLFTAVVGPEPSILRASISGAIAVVALYRGYRKQALPALGASIIILLLVHPTFATSPGFTLSTTTTFALIMGATPVWNYFYYRRHIPRRISKVLSVSLIAHFTTMPITVYFFGQISTCGIIANLLVAPILPVLTVVGMLGIVISAVQPAWGAGIIVVAWPAIRWIQFIGATFGTASWTLLEVPPGAISALITISILTTLILLATSRLGRIVLASTITVASIMTAVHWGCVRPTTTYCVPTPYIVTFRSPRIVEIPYSLSAVQLSTLPPAEVYTQITPAHELSHRPLRTPSGVPVLQLRSGTQVRVDRDGRICLQGVAR